MTAPRSTFLLLLVAACLALTAGPAFAEPEETPPTAPPADTADETEPTDELPAVDEAEEIVDLAQAASGHLPSTAGPKIPRIIGRMPREASRTLSAWRLRLENVLTAPAYVGRVVDQHPDAGSTLAPGEVVTLVVGIPTFPSRDHTRVPAIESLAFEAGIAALREQGFDVMLRAVESYDRDEGVVLAQAPRPDSVAPRGSKVTVLVGKGGLGDPVEPLPATTEEIVDIDETAPPAEPPVVDEPPVPPAEEPPAEEPPAPEGELPVVDEAEETVDLAEATSGQLPDTDGPKIPRVVGRMPREANRTLSAWRLRVENVLTAPAYVGRVVDQHPDAGSTLAHGEIITLVVGIPTMPSRDHTCVPAIENLALEAGAAALRKQGFDVVLQAVESYDRDKDVVLIQTPRPDSVVPRGSEVTVLVGKGGLGDPVEPLPATTEEIVDIAETVPADEPPAPVVEDTPVPVPVEPARPKIMLRVPTLVGPATGETSPCAFGSTFRWGSIPGATTYEWELQVEARDGTWSTAATETVEGSSHRPKRMEAGSYRWRVRALADDAESGWSRFRTLHMYGP